MIETQQLDFSYSEKKILNHILLSIHEGEIFTIIGPNGCGKSTLLSLIAGLIDAPYNKQSITIDQKPLTSYRRKDLAKKISILPQSQHVPNISILQLVEHGRYPYLDLTKQLHAKDHEIIKKALQTMHLDDLKDKLLSQLSGGERQRAYIALSLAQDTPILFMDEPTTYFDVYQQFEFMEIMKALNHEHNKTIVMVLHDLELALKYSHRIAVMNKGQLIGIGTPQEILQSGVISNVFHIQCHPIQLHNATEYIITPCK
jgi:iron complex transport system ATP-binding protein